MLANIGCKLGLARLANMGARAGLMPYLRSVNYHKTPEETRNSFKSHISYYVDNFEDINEERLFLFFNKELKLTRPGIIIGFDDGYEDNYFVAAEELKKAKMTGWFYIITERVGKKDDKGRPFMSWEQIRELKQHGHVIGCHTLNHLHLATLKDSEVQNEIVSSKSILENKISANVSSFCFPFGGNSAYSKSAIHLAVKNYTFLFTSCPGFIRKPQDRFNIGRTHVESDWKISSVEYVCSGLLDIKYFNRKKRYNILLR